MTTSMIAINVDVTAYDRGDYWAGKIEQTGTFVYAADLEAVRARAGQALDLLFSHYARSASPDKLIEYLSSHNIAYTVGPATPSIPRHFSMERELQVSVA